MQYTMSLFTEKLIQVRNEKKMHKIVLCHFFSLKMVMKNPIIDSTLEMVVNSNIKSIYIFLQK